MGESIHRPWQKGQAFGGPKRGLSQFAGFLCDWRKLYVVRRRKASMKSE